MHRSLASSIVHCLHSPSAARLAG
eukprot:COSAG05_NODE_23258_length_259_cov_0.650000_2_plen_23_part_01